MSEEEWKAKYSEIIALANDLDSCPYYTDIDIRCDNCPIAYECAITRAISDILKIK